MDAAPATYVVGIGASAGGLDALERFFDNLPPDPGMAFVVVQHLSPDFKSLMHELLARHTRMPIHLVEDGMPIRANHVFLIPPKKEMIISGGRLLLSERDQQKQELSLPIDVFFRSLAQDCGEHAVAIVLSGGGSDGSRGVRDVHDAGGLVLVQNGETAQFDGMPRTARDAGAAHEVLAPEDMPRALLEHTRRIPARVHRGDPDLSERHGMGAVFAMLEREFGIDFTHYKPSTVTRRIERRIQLARMNDIDEYVARLRGEREELDVLYRDLLIGVTRFFRNEEAFDILETRVLPELLRKGPAGTPLRVWVAGCATGEEVYSLAIVLAELNARSHAPRPVKIFASDVHRGSLEIAARAVYDEDAVKNVSSDRLERYFLRRGKTYQVVPDLRQDIVFAPHNVIRDAPFTRLDLVTCRNLLIYLQPAAQQKVLSLFHFALNRGGILFLGPSESPGPLLQDFESIDRHWRIYRKYSDVRIPVDARFQPVKPHDMRIGPIAGDGYARHPLSQLLGTYDALLDECMPPSLLVDARGELVHSFAGASRFLKPRDGRQGLDVLDLVDTELKMVLVGGLKRAMKEPSAIVFKGVRVATSSEPTGGGEAVYKVTLRRVQSRGTSAAQHVLISFERMDGAPERRAASETEIDLDQVSREQLHSLEVELSHTKENLQAAIEELETSNEELQTANEELLASNEELQSTNEELQSVNEELYTVNAEYQRKIAELTEVTNDMDNLLSSTDVGTIFLDAELKIRKFTLQIGEAFSLLPQDVGRSIETFTHSIVHPGLNEDLKRVLATGERFECEVKDRKGRNYYLRILPYRAKGAVAGVVLTLIDVTGLKAAEDALFHERYLLDSLLFGVPDAIYFRDRLGKFIRANRAMAARLGLSEPQVAVGKTPFELLPREAALAMNEQDEVVMRTGQPQLYRLEKSARGEGEIEWDLVTRLPLRDQESNVVGMIGLFRDVTEQKRADEKIQEAVRRRDEFLAMLSHELRNPLGAVVTATALLKSQLPQDGNGQTRNDPAKFLAVLERQSQQMSRLLDDLLEASRVTQNKIELRRRVVDLRQVVKDAADAVRRITDARGIDLTVRVGDVPLWVDGDPARLQQIHVNLLSNAAKYTPRGGRVSIDAARADEDTPRGLVVVRVVDDGAGIPKAMLESVFDLFVQSQRTLDRADGGLGLGLTLVRSLVAMHGGSVTAHSEGEGKGSEFVVRLPLADAPEHGVDPQPARLRSRLRLPNRATRIVVVEDNDDSREMLCTLLTRAGFDCWSANDGGAALTLIRDVRPDLCIVDVGLPGIDGFELARKIRSDPKLAHIPLIALTGYGQDGDRRTALDAGFDEHLVKPVEAESLKRLLAN